MLFTGNIKQPNYIRLLYIRTLSNYRYKEVLSRCKTRSITIPVRKPGGYWYELTDFGYELYKLVQLKQREGVFAPNAINIQKETKTTP